MQAIIFHNNKCSKSRKTLDILKEKRIDFKIVEYLKTPPNKNELKFLLTALKIDARDLIRKNETEYLEQGLDDLSLSEDFLIEAMINTPKLINRPIVKTDKGVIIGRPPENVLKII